ncbi:MAG: DUF512 domain-containing protein [Thermodesulfovibrionales bacterium]|nr:DUF512 domain-containing protein [Thermodesulfovibrionales bacterium]
MRDKQGITVESVAPGSAALRAGIAGGDVILSINGHSVADDIDYLFHSSEPELLMEVIRDGKPHSVKFFLKEGEDPGMELRQFKIKTCRNNCIFCFVAQLPRGLRKTLYVKDEDYRMSFLYGNYITMTNLSDGDKQRIIKQRLSPLYISVHATDMAVRNKMLGNPKAPDIMKELRFLKENRIKMHVQIVLCPGINDGKELQNTIRHLHSLYPQLLSIAVVPVGLTAHRKIKLKPVQKDDAEKAIGIIEGFQRRFRKKHGDPIVYGADELYIKAELPFPHLKDYGDLPQLENGVGTVPLFLSQAKKIKLQAPYPLTKRHLTFTGVSFYPYLKKFLEKLSKSGISTGLVPVENQMLGSSVTVTGLLSGRDVIRALAEKAQEHDVLLIPDVVLRDGNDLFLDDISPKNIEETLGIEVKVIESTPEGLIKGIVEK